MIDPEIYPPGALRLRSGEDLELRPPDDADLAVLADLARAGIHDPETMPFVVAWTDQPPEAVGRSVAQWTWRTRGEASPASWTLPLAVVVDGQVAGLQSLTATGFAVTREVRTGSWLGRTYQGRGLGTRMRLAVLSLAFEHLGALTARTTAWHDNVPSNRVSQRAGYLVDGEEVGVVRGGRRLLRRYVLPLECWRQQRHPSVLVAGLDERCRAFLDVPTPPGA